MKTSLIYTWNVNHEHKLVKFQQEWLTTPSLGRAGTAFWLHRGSGAPQGPYVHILTYAFTRHQVFFYNGKSGKLAKILDLASGGLGAMSFPTSKA